MATALLLTPYMLTTRSAAIKEEWRANKAGIIAVAAMNAVPYLAVLFTLTTNKVSYVSSVREVSVVFGALLGTLVLREPFGRSKILGALLIFAGIACIGLAR